MHIRFDRGTLVLEAQHAGEDPSQIPGAAWDPEQRAWRVPADHHRSLLVRLSATSVRDPDKPGQTRTRSLSGAWSLPELRWYQREAVAAWRANGRRGVLALPTGSGKTVTALAALRDLGVPALVLVPTRVLLDQWHAALSVAWPHPIGRIGDGSHDIRSLSVATYASAIAWAPRIGDRFDAVVVDEAHHLGAFLPTEVLEMLTAPARLGLTATPPDDPASLARLELHLGPVVYTRSIDELAGDALSAFDLETVPVALTRAERAHYTDARARFTPVYRAFQRALPSAPWSEFVRTARQTTAGRDALAAWREYRSLLAFPAEKQRALRDLLTRHHGERVLIFTGNNATAYAIARELLVMPITHEISRAERASALDRFRAGTLPVLVSSQVLDEGLDVPDADIAIIVGGTSSTRRQIQRVGRVLRPRENKRARIYELAVADTVEVATVERRRAAMSPSPPKPNPNPTGDTP